ncbi:type II toxin-antitoxin system prevent-host-death family antitoxin [Candidatus Poribacteria bacterium]|nr:type II toxin-antitoxin system prevent-host-death family antitoxin [Candidatus Poribacteria bacterium]MYK95961.1 type II toxin-antitoxin system prevent-host-death family antitoxin [Candidatus Poribacteria bacterium]
MTEIGVHEAKTHFSKLLKRVEEGERFSITNRGKVVAVMMSRHDIAGGYMLLILSYLISYCRSRVNLIMQIIFRNLGEQVCQRISRFAHVCW